MAATETMLEKLMGKQGIKQVFIADVLGVSEKRVKGLRTGKYKPTLDEALALSNHFGVRIEEFTNPQPKEQV